MKADCFSTFIERRYALELRLFCTNPWILVNFSRRHVELFFFQKKLEGNIASLKPWNFYSFYVPKPWPHTPCPTYNMHYTPLVGTKATHICLRLKLFGKYTQVALLAK